MGGWSARCGLPFHFFFVVSPPWPPLPLPPLSPRPPHVLAEALWLLSDTVAVLWCCFPRFTNAKYIPRRGNPPPPISLCLFVSFACVFVCLFVCVFVFRWSVLYLSKDACPEAFRAAGSRHITERVLRHHQVSQSGSSVAFVFLGPFFSILSVT